MVDFQLFTDSYESFFLVFKIEAHYVTHRKYLKMHILKRAVTGWPFSTKIMTLNIFFLLK